MNLCQPNTGNASCGACCGILNLRLQPDEIRKLISERTREFEAETSWAKPNSIREFRLRREESEKTIPKYDETTYNCPFLGYLDGSRIGCLIHPVRSGDEKSQNYSFYGASICQTYDCRNKERPTHQKWLRFLEANFSSDSITYSRIAGNHRLLHAIEKAFHWEGVTLNTMFLEYTGLLIEILSIALRSECSTGITSFELPQNSEEGWVLLETLIPEESLLEELKNLKKSVPR